MIVVLDKPAGRTSAWCVRLVGRRAGLKAGHTGTLDPAATGLLVVCLGESRKLVSLLTGHDKRYRAVVRLGVETDTLDAEGEVIARRNVPPLDAGTVREALSRLAGCVRQRVPGYSAVKVGGRRMHRVAREGGEVPVRERQVTVHALDLVDLDGPDVHLDVRCSAGTYVRVLARDLGRLLHTVAHLAFLRRTECGPLGVDAAPDLEEVLAACSRGDLPALAVPARRALSGRRLLRASNATARRLRLGREVSASELEVLDEGDPPAVVLDPDGNVACIARSRGGLVVARRVLHAQAPSGDD